MLSLRHWFPKYDPVRKFVSADENCIFVSSAFILYFTIFCRQYTDADQTATDRGSGWNEPELTQTMYPPSYEDPRMSNYPSSRSSGPTYPRRRMRDQHGRQMYSSSSRLDPNYGTDSFTSDQSESPGGRSGSVSGWSVAGVGVGGIPYTTSRAARYSGPSETEYLQESYPVSQSTYLTPKGSYLHRTGKTG